MLQIHQFFIRSVTKNDYRMNIEQRENKESNRQDFWYSLITKQNTFLYEVSSVISMEQLKLNTQIFNISPDHYYDFYLKFLFHAFELCYQNYITITMKDRSGSKQSEGDGEFNFGYEFDISVRKVKQGQNKQQSGYDFDDFKDVDNKTWKSEINSQKKYLPSELLKKSDDSLIITENQTQISGYRKGVGGSFFVENNKMLASESDQQSPMRNILASPKFNNQKAYQTIPYNMYNQQAQIIKQQQKMKQTLPERFQNGDKSQFSNKSHFVPQNQGQNTKSRQLTISLTNRMSPKNQQSPTVQSEYKDLNRFIQFYQAENQKIEYETLRVIQEIQETKQLLTNNEAFRYELGRISQKNEAINKEINNERIIEMTLVDNIRKLQDQFQNIALSIESLKFQRPSVMKDQTKAIMNQINELKAEFQNLKREEGSLSLSMTIHNPLSRFSNQPTSENRLNAPSFSPEKTLMNQLLSQINQISQTNIYSNFIFNIKMFIIKEEWKLFQDGEICIYGSTRQYPIMQLRIGNKTGKSITDIKLREGTIQLIDKQVLQSKSYYIHSIKMLKIVQPFLKVELSYKSNVPNSSAEQPMKILIFYLPFLPLKHGQFIPITIKQYYKESEQHQNSLQEQKVIQKPIDRKIIRQNLSQILIYFPNLIYQKDIEREQQFCRGIFRIANTHQGSLVKIRLKDGRISIWVKNNLSYLMESLQFLLTLQV